MVKKCLVSLVIAGLICSSTLAAEDFDWAKEQVGKLHYGLAEKEVKQIISGQLQRGKEEKWGADGQYHQEWKYPEAGLTLGMVSKKKGGAKSAESISVASPSTLKTQRGIGIGSTESEVAKAYGPFRNAGDSTPGERFVAGSNFGGVIFNFEQGKVSNIFIGAAAE